MKRALPSPAVLAFMRYSIVFSLLLFWAGASWASAGHAQGIDQMRLTLNLTDVTIDDVFDAIERQTGLSIIYIEGIFEDGKKYSIQANQQTVRTVLNGLLKRVKADIVERGDKVIIARQKATGTIGGRLTDAISGEALIGAFVTVSGTSLGATSDTEGRYEVAKVPEGVYSLRISYIGYSATEVPGVEVKEGATTIINVKLEPASNNLDEVVVTAIPDVILENSTDRSVLNEGRLASNIVTGISHEQISKSMDRDAAEVVRRATGVTLADDRFAMVRGFDTRYTLTLLNDFPAPSAESDRNAFSFDMINSSNIDRIMIYKMPSAELPGNQAGGIVKIYTKNSANRNQLNIQLSTQYRPGSSFEQYYKGYSGKYDKLGFDDGSRDMPDNIPSAETFPQPENTMPEANAENAVLARSFPNNWNFTKANSNLDKRLVLNYYANIPFKGIGSLNSLSSITYTQTTNLNDIHRRFGFAFYDSAGINLARVGDKPVDAINSDSEELSATEGTRLTGMQNFRWTINDNHALEFKNFLNQQSSNRTTLRDLRDGEFAELYATNVQRKVLTSFRARTLYNGLLSGEHKLPSSVSVNWRVGYGFSSDKQPDFKALRFQTYDPLPGFGTNSPDVIRGSYGYVPTDVKLAFENMRGYNNLYERAYTGMLDATKNFPGDIVLRAGLFYDYRRRSFVNRQFSYAQSGTDVPVVAGPDVFMNANVYFEPGYFKNDGSGAMIYDVSGNQLGGPANNLYRYEASNKQQAAYISALVPLLHERFTIYAGVRGEKNHFNYPGMFAVIGESGMEDIVIDQKRQWLLPSAMLTYKPAENMIVRAAYGKSLNRQEFREQAPIKMLDLDRNLFYEGNHKLVPAEIHNFDLRWEVYPGEGDEILSVGGYYKRIINAIEMFTSGSSGHQRDLFFPINTPRTSGYGLELEARKRLNFLPGKFFDHLSLNANLTLLHTEVHVGDVLDDMGTDERDLRSRVRPMVGASPYSFNAALYYENKATGTQISVMLNALGERLAAVGNAYSAEVFTMRRQTLDFSFTQSLSDRTRLRIGVQDVLNQPIRTYRDRDRSQSYNPQHVELYDPEGKRYVRDYMEEYYRPGSYWSAGLMFTL